MAVRDIITFKYSSWKYAANREIYSGKILKEFGDRIKVKIIKALNIQADRKLEGNIIDIHKKNIIKGYTESKIIQESLKFTELKEYIKQWAIQNNLILKDEEKEEMKLEDDDFVFTENLIEFEKLRKKLGIIQEKEIDFEDNKIKLGLFRDLNANEFVAWYLMQ